MERSITQAAIVPITEPVATGSGAGTFTLEQIDIIKNSVAKGVSDQELAYFLEVCRSTGLNPLHRQIYAIVRSGKMTIQTGIDGYRLLATRSRRHAGTDDAQYDTETAPHPTKATVTVYRLVGGQRCAFTATARWTEYRQDNGQMWTKFPYLMLGKCAEALALRKAFPAETSGIYTHEEMDQADTEPIQQQTTVVEGHFPGSTPERLAVFQEITERTNPLAAKQETTWEDLQMRSKDLGFNLPQFSAAKKKYPTVAKMSAALDEFEKKRMNLLKRRANELGWKNDEWEKALKDTGGNYDQMVDRVEAVPQTVEG